MLTEERYQAILDLLEAEGSVTIQQLMTAIDVSESTVRRDLNAMAKKGLLQKVYGGALPKERTINTIDEEVQKRKEMYCDEKCQIARYAAELIVPKDFVYLDAGTTTERMIDDLVEKEVTFVTNAIHFSQANKKLLTQQEELKNSKQNTICKNKRCRKTSFFISLTKINVSSQINSKPL